MVMDSHSTRERGVERPPGRLADRPPATPHVVDDEATIGRLIIGKTLHPGDGASRFSCRTACRVRLLLAVLLLLPACTRSDAPPTDVAPARPLPLRGTIVRVSTVDELVRAAREARANTTIALEPGLYVLSEPLRIGGMDGPPAVAVDVRGATGTRTDVTLEGAGIEVANAHEVQIGDLTFRALTRPAIHVRGEAGARRTQRRRTSGSRIFKLTRSE